MVLQPTVLFGEAVTRKAMLFGTGGSMLGWTRHFRRMARTAPPSELTPPGGVSLGRNMRRKSSSPGGRPTLRPVFPDRNSRDSERFSNQEPQPSWGDILPRKEFFASAQKSGSLPFGRVVAVDIASRVWIHEMRHPNDTGDTLGKNLCERFSIQPLDLTVLSIVLNQSPSSSSPGDSNYIRRLARLVLKAASSMAEPAAVIRISTPLLLGRSSAQTSAENSREAFERILELAIKKKVVEAMLLVAEVYSKRNQTNMAMKFWQEASKNGSAHAAVMIGKSRARLGDREGMKTALLEATRLGNADSYLELSISDTQRDPTPSLSSYSLIAASSGVAAASHNLGEYYRRCKQPSDTHVAEQWYRIAAEAGVDWSMLQLAKILKDRGNYHEAAYWVKLATYGSQEVQAIAIKLMA